MPRPAAPVLEYSKPVTVHLSRVWRWSAILLAALPVAAVLSVHAVYAVEWVVNGEPPIPPHHGPANAVEAVLYHLSAFLLISFPFSLVATLLFPAVGRPKGAGGMSAVLYLPLACWVASAIILGTDPFGAMFFWFD